MPASNEVSQHLEGLVSAFTILWSLFLFVCLSCYGVVSMNELVLWVVKIDVEVLISIEDQEAEDL